jgi:hypothetical protein
MGSFWTGSPFGERTLFCTDRSRQLGEAAADQFAEPLTPNDDGSFGDELAGVVGSSASCDRRGKELTSRRVPA